MKTLSLALLTITLCNCSHNLPTNAEEKETLYEKNSKQCLVTNGSSQIITLQENVDINQGTAIAKLESGNDRIIDVEYITDINNCY